MAEAVLEVLLQNLSSFIQREIGVIWGVDKRMEKLASTLSTIRAVMEDAEMKQLQDKAIQNWLRKLERAAYQLDDVLDECVTEATRLELKLSVSHLLTCYSTPDKVAFRYKIGNKMKEIEKELDHMAEERHMFHLQEVRQVGVARSRQATFSIVTQPQVYGRGEDLEYVVEQLVQHAIESQDLSVLPVVGMGGLGKTTLAQLAFNDDRVVEHFELRNWVCVSDEDFDLKKIIKAIMESICNETCEDMQLDPLLKRLREKLNGKRYFLVLDDVWRVNQQIWEDLRGVLNCGSRGASVVVTTRLQTVASIMGTLPPRNLSVLSEDDCWKLFKHRAFGAEREESAQLVAIGKEIVKRCGGVPLAAKALGSLMRFKTNEQEWQMVKESEIWRLPQDDDNSILPALRLSYVNLPAELRQCFAYCSVFPKDSKMEKEKVIQMWMANGFIQPIENLDLEDIGDEIWRELYGRSFFQEVKNDEFGDVKSFKMHDLIHDLATSITDRQCNHPAGSSLKGRSHLRTLRGEIEGDGFKYSAKNFISLRVFSGRWQSKLTNFIHLRYLDLSSNKMQTLPNSIGNLLNLQTLNLNGCWNLRKLRGGITRLRSLRHLYMNGCHKVRHMPAGIGRLKNLKTLTLFIADGRRGCGLDELELLNLGGKLAIKHLERVGVSGGVVNLAGKQNIRSLELHWKPDAESESELQGNAEQQLRLLEALQPHPNLKSLAIGGYGSCSIPPWMSNQILQNLHFIKIEGCHNCRHLPGLGQLPFLKRLEIGSMRYLRHLEDDGFRGEGVVATFPSLKSLKIYQLPCLEKLCKEDGRADVLPCLSDLDVERCPKLSLPCLSSLKQLRVWQCSNVLLRSISNLSCHLTSLFLAENEEDFCFPEGMLRNLTGLHSLQVLYFRKLKMLPTQLESLSALRSLGIQGCDELESLNFPAQGLRFLQDLRLDDCPKLKSMPEVEALQHLTALQSLSIQSPTGLKSFLDGVGMLTSLRSLDIHGCPETVSLPDSIQSLASLRMLRLWNMPNLKSLPSGLGKLTSLQSLNICNCPELASLPESIKGLTNLKTSEIIACRQLRRRYNKRSGEECQVIAYIPHVDICKVDFLEN